jgi:hypothetical protein
LLLFWAKNHANKVCLQNNKNPKFEAPFIWQSEHFFAFKT